MNMRAPATVCPATATLERVAGALGLSVDAFQDPAIRVRIDGEAEMLRLWASLESDDRRRAMLDAARALVSAQAG